MKTRKALSLFFCTVAFAASAATVSVDKAKFAAGSWALSDASLGVPHGRTVSGATAYDVDGTTGFYAVALEGGGTLFLAADDEIGPVIGFTSSSEPDLTEGSPLRILLEKDIAARRGILAISSPASNPKLTASSGSASTSIASASSTNAKALWSALAPVLSVSSNPKLTMASATPRDTGAISDMRVEPLVESQWSQTDAGGGYCYNYYTPDHDPCGCTATAASQIMRYFNYPDHDLPPITRTCKVNNEAIDLTSIGDSRSYSWGDMKLIPKNSATELEREAIGRLTYDVGVALYSDYTSSGTGADPQRLGELYQGTYDYASGVTYWNESGWDTGNGGLHTRELRNKIIYANLDARRPVQLAIYFNGHSVVCDGYGFVIIGGVETEFAHINMGWAGTDDMWYNIPEIDAANSGAHEGDSGMTFEYMGGAQFNIHPTETGDLLTGRVVDDGEPVETATVSVYKAGESTPIASVQTDVHGIYSFCLEGGKTYNVMAVSADGKKSGTADGVVLQTTVEDNSGEFVHVVTQESRVGNSWGNDIDIVIPHVRIVGENNYPSLNSALAAASTMENPVVEIFGPTKLKAPVTITTNVTIRTVPGPSADYPNPTLAECEVIATDDTVTTEGWVLQVADGVRVDFSNIVIRTEANAPVTIDVLETGKAAFSGHVDLGTVTTHAADAFILAGPLELEGNGLAVSCPFATEALSPFGTYECSDEVATACAQLIANALDLTLIGRVYGGALVWDNEQPISPTIAFAYATNDTLGTRYYLSVDQLFKHYTNGAEVVFLKDCPESMFTNAVVVGKSMTIRSEGDSPFVVTLGKDASFTVQGEDTELVFTNIVFKRTGTPSANFATVKGGASLVLASGATIADLRLAGTASAVYVDSGSDMEMTNKVTMLKGSVITNCVATRLATGRAGGVYLTGENSLFDFAGGLITGCVAGHNTGGGAVYAGKGATVAVSGSATAYGNKAKNNTRNIYVQSFESLILTYELTGEVGVYCYRGIENEDPFATVGAELDDALKSRKHFHNDYNASLYAETSEDFTTLVWAAEPPGPKPVPEVDAEARLIVGSETNTYATVGDAFEAAGFSDARIELVTAASLSANITVSSAIVFDGMDYTLSRAGNFCISVTNGAQLIVTNMTMNGGIGIGRILDVQCGSLTLEDGAIIENVNGTNTTACVAAIVVWGGKFTVNPGAAIRNCKNPYARERGGPLAAGGVVALNSKDMTAEVYLNGGEITDCSGAGYGVGGISIGNRAVVSVKGNAMITGNTVQTNKTTAAIASNLVVQDLSGLTLNGELARNIGYTEGVGGNTNVFGTVDADFLASTTPSNVAVSAHSFRHDQTRAKGMVATNETEAILVWSSAVGDSTMFTNVVGNVTNVYDVIRIAGDDDPEVVECAPFAFAAIEEVSPGTWKLTLKPGTEFCVYTLKTSDDLVNWTQVGDKKTLSAGEINDELEFFFEVDDTDGKKFWKVEGANGIK